MGSESSAPLNVTQAARVRHTLELLSQSDALPSNDSTLPLGAGTPCSLTKGLFALSNGMCRGEDLSAHLDWVRNLIAADGRIVRLLVHAMRLGCMHDLYYGLCTLNNLLSLRTRRNEDHDALTRLRDYGLVEDLKACQARLQLLRWVNDQKAPMTHKQLSKRLAALVGELDQSALKLEIELLLDPHLPPDLAQLTAAYVIK